MPSSARVLVVEDNPVNQKLTRILLENDGYVVDTVADGAQAVEAVARGGYDLVLMDCQMPVMDGYAAVAEIRRREAGGNRVPIVALTASAMAGDAERALGAGMDAHVTKPIDAAALSQVLKSVLNTAAVGQTSQAAGWLDDLQVIDGTGESLRLLAEMFVKDAPDRIGALVDAFSAEDLDRVAATAHFLTGSAAAFGATRVVELTRAIEGDAREGRLPRDADVTALRSLFDQLVDHLRTIVGVAQLTDRRREGT